MPMDIILLEDLEGLGAKGSLVHVKPGYARNYLLPRRLAIAAGEKAANLYTELERQRTAQADKRIAQARAEAAKLDGVEVNIPAEANEEDTLFGSVTNADVADALKKAGHDVDKRRIELTEHIKQLGRYDVPVRIYHEVTATVKVWVVRA
jgi:large subunit ribosomal protein L9